MQDYTQYKEAYDRDGFVLVRNFLPQDEFGNLLENLDRYIRDVVPTIPDSGAFYQDKSRPETLKQMQHMAGFDPFFQKYRSHARWNALATALVGETVEAQEPEWFNKPPATEHPTPAHQDNYYFNLKPPNVAAVWMAIDPIDDENGCLRYCRGSHLKGLRPHGQTSVLGFSQGVTDYGPEDEESEVAIHLLPGDAIVHHGEVIHRAEPNRSTTRHRRASAMVFYGASCKIDEERQRKYQQSMKGQHQEMGLQTSDLDQSEA